MELREGRLIANTLTALIPDGNALGKMTTEEKKNQGEHFLQWKKVYSYWLLKNLPRQQRNSMLFIIQTNDSRVIGQKWK